MYCPYVKSRSDVTRGVQLVLGHLRVGNPEVVPAMRIIEFGGYLGVNTYEKLPPFIQHEFLGEITG